MNEYLINGKKYKFKKKIPIEAIVTAFKVVKGKNLAQMNQLDIFLEMLESENLKSFLNIVLENFSVDTDLVVEDWQSIIQVLNDFFILKMKLNTNIQNISKS